MNPQLPLDKIFLASVNQCPFDWDNNVSNLINCLEEAKSAGAELVLFPELALTGYSCEDTFLSGWLVKNALENLKRIVPHTKGIFTNIGIPIRLNNQLYNCSVIIDNEEIIGIAAKQNLANDGVYYEPRWFAPWPKGKVEQVEILGHIVPIGEQIFDFRGVKVGFEICEDAWHEESRPGNQYTLQQVDILLNPSASHFSFGKAFFRRDLVIESSRKFDCLYLYSNLLGNDSGRLIFDGEMLAAYKGKLLASNRFFSFKSHNLMGLSNKTEMVEEDLSDFEFFPRAVSLALFDYMRRSKTKGFVISLSGGADSSCCAVIIHEMVKNAISELGIDGFKQKLGFASGDSLSEIMNQMLVTVYQATDNSSNETFESAKALSEHIQANFLEWDVENLVRDYRQLVEEKIGRKFTWENDDLPLQNVQARARVPGLWLLANQLGYLLISTSNRSELDVGYATMDGDTAGSLAPIAGVSKHFVLNWLRYAYEELGYQGLEQVVNLTPTAELRPPDQDQTDEEDLMPYRVLNLIEKFAIGLRMSPAEVYEKMIQSGYEKEPELKGWIKKFFILWHRNQWKRERTAPSFHLDDLNVDPKTWCRFPILSGGFEQELRELEKK